MLFLSNRGGMNREVRRGMLDDLATLNELKYAEFGDPEIVTRIAQYEVAYKMQASAPELTDFSIEPEHVPVELRAGKSDTALARVASLTLDSQESRS